MSTPGSAPASRLGRLSGATIAAVAVNVLVLLASSGQTLAPWVRRRHPHLGPPLWLGLVANSQLIAAGQWYRLVTPSVLHADAGTLPRTCGR